ncbi:hypothetical protein [Glycomyces harbinensis]|uniref:Uncharacterized protein n=1 Tax=Glycomyces harbinensis TaxID=58114 RepID=A0A1G6WNQ9_9ACTN|nr:hypothetical protein [Glycomyces harbinensis]SDD67512.1 hypothetical protein SAMN05216270_106138 [Glycomyces harbinensis]
MAEPRPGRLRTAIAALVFRMQALTVLGYAGVASIIGVEALIVVLGFTTVLPIAIPFVLIVLAAVYFFRERLRAVGGRLRVRLGKTTGETREAER